MTELGQRFPDVLSVQVGVGRKPLRTGTNWVKRKK